MPILQINKRYYLAITTVIFDTEILLFGKLIYSKTITTTDLGVVSRYKINEKINKKILGFNNEEKRTENKISE